MYCPKLRRITTRELSTFLLKKFNEEKVTNIIREFKRFGFTSQTLLSELNNLFQFLVLIAYDRRPFSPYEIVWDKENPCSVFSVLEENCLLDLSRIRSLPEDQLHELLERCRVKGLVLSYLDLGKRIKAAKMMKDIASKVEEIASCLNNLKSGNDVVKLHKMIDDIYGIGPTIASKFIMYVVRCMGVGNIDPSEYGVLASSLKSEWRNSKWVRSCLLYTSPSPRDRG